MNCKHKMTNIFNKYVTKKIYILSTKKSVNSYANQFINARNTLLAFFFLNEVINVTVSKYSTTLINVFGCSTFL